MQGIRHLLAYEHDHGDSTRICNALKEGDYDTAEEICEKNHIFKAYPLIKSREAEQIEQAKELLECEQIEPQTIHKTY